MYKCLYCGFEFEKPELWHEEHGEAVNGCPNCGSPYEEMEKCENCDEYHGKSEMHCGMCDDCLKEYYNRPKDCFDVAKFGNFSEQIMINGFLTSFLTGEEIEGILLDWALHNADETFVKEICSEFVESDKDWFAEQALKGGVIV